MQFRIISCGVLWTFVYLASAASQDTIPVDSADERVSNRTLSLDDGDRVVFLGDTFFERARYYGQIETALSLCWPDTDLRFRNLGWSGDTVGGIARTSGRRGARFGTEAQGFRRLVDHVESLSPTHIFVAYGFNESFEGEDGLEAFVDKLDRLLTSIAPADQEVILLSPLPMEHGFGATKLEVDGQNALLAMYSDVIRSTAREKKYRYIDLFDTMKDGDALYSVDGIHPTEAGYARIAHLIVGALNLQPTEIDEEARQTLRKHIIQKNALYFHRWRPRNDAFVYGERKDEQPIAQTEPEAIENFIEEQEALIRELLSSVGR